MTSSPLPTATLSGSDAYFNLMKSNLSNQVPRPATPSRQRQAAAAVASSLVVVAFYLISILWSVWRFLLICAKHSLRPSTWVHCWVGKATLYIPSPSRSPSPLPCLPCLLTNCQQLVIAATTENATKCCRCIVLASPQQQCCILWQQLRVYLSFCLVADWTLCQTYLNTYSGCGNGDGVCL